MFSIDFLNELRAIEIDKIAGHFRAGARILEIGAGTGKQAMELRSRGFNIEAIEILSSNYADTRLFPITNFDGRHIPFPDASFDIVFSSNVLEHVPDLEQMHREIARVLRPGGYAVHVLPTHAWRFWTTLSAFPAGMQYATSVIEDRLRSFRLCASSIRSLSTASLQAARHLAAPFVQPRHGERGTTLTETWYFRPAWWRANFRANSFDIIRDEPMGLFYTGNMVFGQQWSWEKRARLARILGCACHIFEIKPVTRASAYMADKI